MTDVQLQFTAVLIEIQERRENLSGKRQIHVVDEEMKRMSGGSGEEWCMLHSTNKHVTQQQRETDED